MIRRLIKGFIVVSLGFMLGCGGFMKKTTSFIKSPFGTKEETGVQGSGGDHMERGRGLFQAGDMKDAFKEFEQAVAAEPDSPQAHYNLALTSYELGMYADAIAHYQSAIRLKPDLVEAHFNLGVAYDQDGKPDKALQSYKQAQRYGAEDASLHFNMGVSLLKLSQAAEAKKEFLSALELSPNLPEAYNNLGYVAEAEGDLDGAVAMYKKALALKPDYPMARENMERLVQEKPPAPVRPPVSKKKLTSRLSVELDGKAGFARDVEMEGRDGKVDVGSQYKRALLRLGYNPTEWMDLFIELGGTDMGFDDTITVGTANVDFKRVLGFAYGAGIEAEFYRWDRMKMSFDGELSFLTGSNKDEYKDGLKATVDWMEYTLALKGRYHGLKNIVPYGGLAFTKVDGTLELDWGGGTREADYNESSPFGILLGGNYYLQNNIRFQSEAQFIHELSLAIRVRYDF